MLKRIEDVNAKFSPSSSLDLEVSCHYDPFEFNQRLLIFFLLDLVDRKHIQSAEMELSLLEPDVATLISRGDSLVLQVQKVDLERALRINSTTGELRVARTALKASSEVIINATSILHSKSKPAS